MSFVASTRQRSKGFGTQFPIFRGGASTLHVHSAACRGRARGRSCSIYSSRGPHCRQTTPRSKRPSARSRQRPVVFCRSSRWKGNRPCSCPIGRSGLCRHACGDRNSTMRARCRGRPARAVDVPCSHSRPQRRRQGRGLRRGSRRSCAFGSCKTTARRTSGFPRPRRAGFGCRLRCDPQRGCVAVNGSTRPAAAMKGPDRPWPTNACSKPRVRDLAMFKGKIVLRRAHARGIAMCSRCHAPATVGALELHAAQADVAGARDVIRPMSFWTSLVLMLRMGRCRRRAQRLCAGKPRAVLRWPRRAGR